MEDDVKQSSTDRYALSQAYRWRAERDKAMQELRQLKSEVEGRLMPEGMEWLLEVWPRWSNGDYCKFGDWWKSEKYGESKPKQLKKLAIYSPEQLREWGQDDGDNFGYEWDFVRPSDPKHRPDKVEPPEHSVLASDGEPLEVGQAVWEVDGTGHPFKVVSIRPSTGRAMEPTVVTCDVGDGTSEHILPSQLTHERPVLDVSGIPIKVGDTVFRTSDGREFEVTGVDGEFEIRVKDESMDVGVWAAPCWFTHAKPEFPDSWERIEEDAMLSPHSYICACGKHDDAMPKSVQMSIDLVRRCRALAERGE